MAHFELAAGRVSRAVAHHTVEEIWYILSGRGRMWRRQGDRQETVPLITTSMAQRARYNHTDGPTVWLHDVQSGVVPCGGRPAVRLMGQVLLHQ